MEKQVNSQQKQTVVLTVLDGYGIAEHSLGNAVTTATTPNLDKFFSENAYTTLKAGGEEVGLPEGQFGNSEVGHTNMGAGRVVYQELSRITRAVEEGEFFENETLLEACKGERLHIMGLLSDGGVHSHIYHIKAMVDMAVEEGVKEVFIHAFLDGRDTPPTSAGEYLWDLEDYISRYDNVKVVTVCGRYFAMDRDNRFDRTEKAYKAIVLGEGNSFELSFEDVEELYTKKSTDEFINPMAVVGYEGMKDGDNVIFANFRPDRARQITRAIAQPEFADFEISLEDRPKVNLYTLTQYDAEFDFVKVIYPPQSLTNTLSEWLSKNGKTQLHISETEKYAHVTFFFAGGIEAPFEGEERILIPSPEVETYDLSPDMSAKEISKQLVKAVKSKKYDFIIVNYANCDMLGHTGKMRSVVDGLHTIDKCIGDLVKAVEAVEGTLIITSDHGNADAMLDERGRISTSHSKSPVPFAVNKPAELREGGALCDIAPTILDIMGMPKPEEMTGTSLIK